LKEEMLAGSSKSGPYSVMTPSTARPS